MDFELFYLLKVVLCSGCSFLQELQVDATSSPPACNRKGDCPVGVALLRLSRPVNVEVTSSCSTKLPFMPRLQSVCIQDQEQNHQNRTVARHAQFQLP